MAQDDLWDPNETPASPLASSMGPSIPAASPLASAAPPSPQPKARAPKTPQSPQAPSRPVEAQNVIKSDQEMEAERARQIQDKLNQKYQTYGDNVSSVKDILDKATQQLQNTPVGPTAAERWNNMVAGLMSAPGIAGTAPMSQAMASTDAQKRMDEFNKQNLMAKYGLESGQMGMQAAQMGIQQLTSQENNAQNRQAQLAIAAGNQNKASAPIIINGAGQPQVNQAAVDVKAAESGAMAAARMHAQMAGITDPTVQNGMMHTAQMVADRMIPMPTISTRTPQGMAMGNALVGMVQTLDPQYNAQDYPLAMKTRTGFNAGSQGDTLRKINNAAEHLQDLNEAGDALVRHDMPAFNAIQNKFQHFFGLSSAPSGYAGMQQLVGDEVNNVFVKTGGGQGERKMAADNLAASLNPDMRQTAITNIQKLMATQAANMRNQFVGGLPGVNSDRANSEFDKKLSPTVLQIEKTMRPNMNRAITGASGNQPTDKDIAYLKAHPETAAKFKAHFGSLPEGVSG